MALCLLCGIPGSGKSTIAHIIQSIIEKETTCKLFSFDDYELDKKLWNETSFKESRLEAISNMKKFIEMNDKIPLVLVDDIMYLRSMRKQVYLIFKQLHIKILTVYVTVSLSLAIERNNHRDSSNVVNTESIIKIANAFEPPAEEFVHDRNHVIIDNTSTETASSGIGIVISKLKFMIDEYKLHHQEAFMKSNVSALKENKRGYDISNTIQIIDQIYRKIISKIIRSISERTDGLNLHLSNVDISDLSRGLSKVKMKCLKLFKQRWELELKVNNSVQPHQILDIYDDKDDSIDKNSILAGEVATSIFKTELQIYIHENSSSSHLHQYLQDIITDFINNNVNEL